MREQYPFFKPPTHLAQNTPREWTKSEADEYYHWLLSAMDERVSNLFDYFDESQDGDNEDVLLRIGERVQGVLNDPELSYWATQKIHLKEYVIEDELPTLTDMGYALAADVGLLLAQCILSACQEKVCWTIVRKPKNDADYNQPVLVGKNDKWRQDHVNPIGTSIAKAYAILRGKRGANAWGEAYKSCIRRWCQQ